MTPTASIILVNYKTPKQTKLCLRSLRRFTRSPCETIVVDNRSEDESTEYLRGLPWIRFLENDNPEPTHRNGLDLGIRHASGDVIVAIHTDTFVREEGWLKTLLGHFGSNTMILGSQDRVILPVSRLNRFDVHRKRRKLNRRWKAKGRSPKCLTHCIVYRRELFTEHGQRFDHPEWIDGVYYDTGELIQRYCDERALEIRLLAREQLAPLFWHFEAATLNHVNRRSLPFKRRWRTWQFYRRADVQGILADDSLDS